MRRARYFSVIAAIALIGCGDEPAPEPDNLEAQLADEVQEETGTPGVILVDCPEDPEVGDRCDVLAGAGLKAKVRITRLEDAEVDGEVVQP